MTALIEAEVEQAALDWLEGLGWRVARRQEGSIGATAAGRVYRMPPPWHCCWQVEDKRNLDG